MKNRRVLITGGLGFIGSNLVHYFHAQGARVTVLDARVPMSGANLFNLHEICHAVDVIDADIRDQVKVRQAVHEKDIIINCAASTSHGVSMEDPGSDADVNAKGVLNILEAMRQQHSAAKFIQIGTTTQLGRQPVNSIADETTGEFPMDIYSAHKSTAEKYTLIYHRAYGLDTTVLRLPNMYGPRAAISSAHLTFNNYFLGLALQGQEIQVYGLGQQMRNILYVEDAVDAVRLAIENKKANGEVFFCTSDEHFSVGHIAQMTVDRVGKGKVSFIPWPPGKVNLDVGDVCISNEKIKRVLGWQPKVNFKTGIAQTVKFYQQHVSAYLGGKS